MIDGPDDHDWQVLGFLQRVAQERDHPPLSDEACRTLRTSRERLEASLEVLLRLGYVTPSPDSPLGYETVPTQPPIHDLTPQQLPIVDVIARLRELHGHPPHGQGDRGRGPAFPSDHPRLHQAARARGLAPHEPRQKTHYRAAQTVAAAAASDLPQQDPALFVSRFVFIPRLGQAAAGRGVAAERLEDGGSGCRGSWSAETQVASLPCESPATP
jgi:hypothetical protein